MNINGSIENSNIYSQYNQKDTKSYDAALNFNYKRGDGKCSGLTTDESALRVIQPNQLSNFDKDTYQILCKSTVKPIDADRASFLADNCYYDATLPAAIFTRTTINDRERDGIEHAFSDLSEKFGKEAYLVDVFELFGEFEPGQPNVLFSDDAYAFVLPSNSATDDNESLYRSIQCRP